MRKPYPTDFYDAEWSWIEPHLPTPKAPGRPRVHSLREILNAIFYIVAAIMLRKPGGGYARVRTAILAVGTLFVGLLVGFLAGVIAGTFGEDETAQQPKTVTVERTVEVTVRPEEDESASASPSASASASVSSEANFDASVTDADKDCQMYKPCKFGSYTSYKTLGSITITDAASQDFIPNETGQGWSGAFVKLEFDYTYGGSVPSSTEDPTMALEDSDGKLYSYAYDPTSSYAIDTGADLFPYSEIQPGTTQDAVVIFEVDPQASGFTLYAWDPIQPGPSEIARIPLNG
jgi:hypothetical protein